MPTTIILFATVANWNVWMDGYLYMNTPDKYPLQTYLATILMESKNNVEALMTPEQLERMARVSEKTIEAAQDASIIVLDEPSSALDPLSEYNLNHTMMNLDREKTVVFISHRLSSTGFRSITIFSSRVAANS